LSGSSLVKTAVKVATTDSLSNITASTSANSLIQDELTSINNNSINIDGVALAVNDRVLIKNNTTHNGIYEVINAGQHDNPSIPVITNNGLSLTSTVIQCGPSDTLSTIVSQCSDGDTIIVSGSIEIEAPVIVNKSIRIIGSTSSPCTITGSSMNSLLSITSANVTISGFTIINTQQASLDASGLSGCINADTMSRTQLGGVSGLTISNMNFYHPKVGVFISGTNWSIQNCEFFPNTLSQTAGTTLRSISAYGSEGSSFIQNNKFTTTIDNARMIAIYLITRNDGIAPAWESGFKGNFTIDGNSFTPQSSSGTVGFGAPRAYIDATSIFHQSGTATTAPPSGEFSLYMLNNDFSRSNQSSPCVFFGRPGSSGIAPLSFFNNIVVKNNSFGSRESSTSQKGALFFTSTGAMTSTDIGVVAGGIYSANNTIATMTLATTNFSIMADSSLLFVRDSTYFSAPTTLIPSQNTGGSQWILTRTTDCNTNEKCPLGTIIPVTNGASNQGKIYFCVSNVNFGITDNQFKSITFGV
jgi:hypothetical protein